MAEGGGQNTKRPRGNASTRARLGSRLEFVTALMVRYPDAETVIRLAKESDWKVPRRTCERDMARVTKRWRAEGALEISLARAKHRRQLARIREVAEKDSDLPTAARLAIKEAEIDGVMAPIMVNVGGNLGVDLDVAGLSLDELRQLKALQGKARAK